jgi:hypothetical protein
MYSRTWCYGRIGICRTSRFSWRRRAKTQIDAYHGGWVDEELAALLSLALGVRCWSGGPIRFWWSAEDDLGKPNTFYHRPPAISRPRHTIVPHIARDRVRLYDCRTLLEGYPTLGPSQATALVRAARQYQLAVWSVDDDANLAWLQLVGALEAAAALQPVRGTSLELIDELWPELADLLRQADLDGAEDVVNGLADLVRATKKIRQLVKRYKPSPLHARPPEHEQVKWSSLTDRVTRIYKLRSSTLHKGVPMPGPHLEPPKPSGDPLPERPGATHGIGDAVWVDEDMPMYFHVFAHVVREVLEGSPHDFGRMTSFCDGPTDGNSTSGCSTILALTEPQPRSPHRAISTRSLASPRRKPSPRWASVPVVVRSGRLLGTGGRDCIDAKAQRRHESYRVRVSRRRHSCHMPACDL